MLQVKWCESCKHLAAATWLLHEEGQHDEESQAREKTEEMLDAARNPERS